MSSDKALETVARAPDPSYMDVLAALSDHPDDTPVMVHRRLGMWSLITVRHALRRLSRDGYVAFVGADCKRRYGRTPAGRALLEAASTSLGSDEGGAG